MIHYLLVPDSAAARKMQRKVAEAGARLGVIVGTWEELRQRAVSAFLVPQPGDSWDEAFGKAVTAMTDAFWSESCATDPDEALAEVRKNLIALIEGAGPEISLEEKPPSNLSERGRRNYSDLLRLWKSLGSMLPGHLDSVRRIIDSPIEHRIRDIVVYSVSGMPVLLPWQKALLGKLEETSGGCPRDPDLQNILESSLSSSSLSGKSAFAHLKANLFSEANKKVPLDDTVCWLGVRDALEEAEVVAGMIQEALRLDSSLSLFQVGILLDGDRQRDTAVAEVFRKAGIPVSGLRRIRVERNLGGEALFNFLVTRRPPAPVMALASLYASLLMPWPEATGLELATSVMAGKFDAVPPVPLSREGEKMLGIIRGKADTPAAMMKAVRNFVAMLPDTEKFERHVSQARESAERMRSIIEGSSGKEIPWKPLRSSIPQAPVVVAEPDDSTREGVAVFYADREAWRDVRHLFVLGFSDGNYPAGPWRSSVFDESDIEIMRAETGLEWPTAKEQLAAGRLRFQRQLRAASERCVFLVPLRNHDGSALSISGSSAFMAQLLPGIADPDDLVRILEVESDRRAVRGLPVAPEAPLTGPRTPDLDDVTLGRDLRKRKDGAFESQSPSRLDTLIVSPLSWLLERWKIVPRPWAPEEFDVMSAGTLAHDVFEHLFVVGKRLPAAKEIEANISRFFSDAVTRIMPFLNAAEWSVERKKLERELEEAAATWRDILDHCGAEILEVEEDLKGDFDGIPIKGRTDAIVRLPDGTRFIVDYKKSSSSRRRTAMENGYDIQASFYRRMLPGDKGDAGILYYMLNSKEGLADRNFGHPDVLVIEGDVSKEAENAVRVRLEELKDGVVRLNNEDDVDRYAKVGFSDYWAKNSPLIAKFMRPVDDSANEDETE